MDNSMKATTNGMKSNRNRIKEELTDLWLIFAVSENGRLVALLLFYLY